MGFPSAWTDGAAWQAVDDNTANLHLAFCDATQVAATVGFDPASGFPTRFEVDRYRAVGGQKIQWRAGSHDWRVADGVPSPSRVDAWWSDQPAPWFEMRVERCRVDVPVEAAMGTARGAIARARGIAGP